MIDLLVIGLGLIGGSVALGAARRGARVTGADVAAVIQTPEARTLGELVDVADPAALRTAVERAELVVLCAPIRAIVAGLPAVLESAGTVTDCGSTKRQLAELAARTPRGERFVPGHPMAGSPEGGLANARADLFEGRRWILCPERSAPDAVARVEQLIGLLGAEIVHMSAADHDRAVALTSHVPQLVASALALLADRRGAAVAAGPAFASATRVAGGAPNMWADIFATNADEISSAVAELCRELEGAARSLGQPEGSSAALALLRAARDLRKSR